MDYYKKYLKYKSKYYKLKGGSEPITIEDVRNKIKIEMSGGNIYAISAAHFYRLLLNLESSSQKNETYQNIYTYLQDTLLRKVNLLKSNSGINQRTVQMCIDRIETILGSSNRNKELKKMVYFVANKVSDLDTKIIIQINSQQDIIQGLQAFGLARIKRFDGELVDLSIPVQNTILGSIVSSSKSKEDRIIEELEIIIFFQDEDGKTDKRINRYIIQNIYFYLGLHMWPDIVNIEEIQQIARTGVIPVIPRSTSVIDTSTSTVSWYNVKARLNKIKATTKEDAQSFNQDIDGNDLQISEDEAKEEVFSQSQNPNLELEDEEDEDSEYREDSLPLLLCRESLILRTNQIVTELKNLYEERQQIQYFDESMRKARIPKKYGGLELFYQIYNPDEHDPILTDDENKHVKKYPILKYAPAALKNKKKEVALKTELHACILGLINITESQDPYITLRNNIGVIITNMNEILQEELLFIDDPDELKSCFHGIESIQEIATICATVLEKMSFNPLLTMWTTEIYNFYIQNLSTEMNLETEKNTMFISLKHERSGTAIVEWDSEVLKEQWEGYPEQNIWLKAHKFISNNIYNDIAVVSSSSQSFASGPLLQSLANASVAPIVLRNQIILFSVNEHYEDESNESNEFTVGEGQFIYVINNNITDIRLYIEGKEVILNKEQLLDAQGYIIVSSSEKQNTYPFNQIHKFFRADIELPEEYDYQVSSSLAENKLLKFLKPREKMQHHINLPQDSKIKLLPQSSMPVAVTTPAITYVPSVSQPIDQSLSHTRIDLRNHTILFSNEDFYEENSKPFTIINEPIRVVNETGHITVKNNDGVSLNKDQLHQNEGRILANNPEKQYQDPFDKVYKFFKADIILPEEYTHQVSNNLAEGKLLKFFKKEKPGAEQLLTLPKETEIYIKELSSSYDSHQYAEPSMNTGLNRSVFSMASQSTHNPMYAQPIYQQCQSVEQKKKKYNYLNNRIIMFRNSVQHSFPLQISNSEGKEIYILNDENNYIYLKRALGIPEHSIINESIHNNTRFIPAFGHTFIFLVAKTIRIPEEYNIEVSTRTGKNIIMKFLGESYNNAAIPDGSFIELAS